jgi:hypothetical protein
METMNALCRQLTAALCGDLGGGSFMAIPAFDQSAAMRRQLRETLLHEDDFARRRVGCQ